jgi:hypothetical protein
MNILEVIIVSYCILSYTALTIILIQNPPEEEYCGLIGFVWLISPITCLIAIPILIFIGIGCVFKWLNSVLCK